MKRLLLAATALLTLSTVSNADIIQNLGANPSSGTGAFANTDPGAGATGVGQFSDVYFFSLLGGPQFVTVASVTNVFANALQFITGFKGSVVLDNGVSGPGPGVGLPGAGFLDIPQFSATATACVGIPDCQGFAGSGILGPGNYYLLIQGDAALNAGYGGNLSTAAVPGPIVGAGLPGLLAVFGLGGLVWRRRKAASQQAS